MGTGELLSVAPWLTYAQATREGKWPADLEPLQRPNSHTRDLVHRILTKTVATLLGQSDIIQAVFTQFYTYD